MVASMLLLLPEMVKVDLEELAVLEAMISGVRVLLLAMERRELTSGAPLVPRSLQEDGNHPLARSFRERSRLRRRGLHDSPIYVFRATLLNGVVVSG